MIVEDLIEALQAVDRERRQWKTFALADAEKKSHYWHDRFIEMETRAVEAEYQLKTLRAELAAEREKVEKLKEWLHVNWKASGPWVMYKDVNSEIIELWPDSEPAPEPKTWDWASIEPPSKEEVMKHYNDLKEHIRKQNLKIPNHNEIMGKTKLSGTVEDVDPKERKFRPGDVVCLKLPGSHTMIVEKINSQGVQCLWVVGGHHPNQTIRDTLPPECLRKAYVTER
jgi:hypothetical protein